MGSNRSSGWCALIVSFLLSSLLLLHASAHSLPYDLHSLHTLIYDSASDALARNPHSGVLYNLSLPANVSAVSASVVRFHGGSFLARGTVNSSSSFFFPPGLFPSPYVKRLALLFQHFGTLSPAYFSVPGHDLAAPVVGFSAYNASPSGLGVPVELVPMLQPIMVLFPNLGISNGPNNVTIKCVTFGTNGSIELVNMTTPNKCTVHVQGHYSVAVESPPSEKKGLSKWWVIGLAAGLGGLAAAIMVGTVVYKVWRSRRIEEMERESEKEVSFDTFWVGGSKMPSAPMVRTQPVLENEYIP